MPIRKSRQLIAGPVGAILVVAILSGCASGGSLPSPSAASQASTRPEQTPLSTAVASPNEQAPKPTTVAVASPTAPPPVSADLQTVKGSVLPIAGRNGAPGAISCGGLGRFTFATIPKPTGAEDLPGPEFDVLRSTIARYGDDPEFASLKAATYGEVQRDASSVVFLGDVGSPEGPFAVVRASFDGAAWKSAGMGDCRLVGEPGDGWGAANWVIDPAFHAPTAKSRKLHLLVSEVDCNPSVPVVGRLAPAYVFLERGQVRIQLFIRKVEPSGSCERHRADGSGPADGCDSDPSGTARHAQARGCDPRALPRLRRVTQPATD